MRSKFRAFLLGAGAAVALVAMVAVLVALFREREIAEPVMALLALGLCAVGAGAAFSFADDGESTPGLQETVSRIRQQIQ